MGDDVSTSRLELSEDVGLEDLVFQNLPGRLTHDAVMHSAQYHLTILVPTRTVLPCRVSSEEFGEFFAEINVHIDPGMTLGTENISRIRRKKTETSDGSEISPLFRASYGWS